jgi:hypothetical protein
VTSKSRKKKPRVGSWSTLGYTNGVTLAQGGIVSSSISVHSGNFQGQLQAINSMSQGIHTQYSGGLIRKVIETTPVCGNRRGGPDSKIYCEVYKHVEHKGHTGRGKTGKWYSWD